jgi:hypothetical protein
MYIIWKLKYVFSFRIVLLESTRSFIPILLKIFSAIIFVMREKIAEREIDWPPNGSIFVNGLDFHHGWSLLLHGLCWAAFTNGLFGVPHQTVQASPRAGIGSLVACTYLQARLSACKSLPAARLPSYAQIDLLCRAWLAGCSCFSPNDSISVWLVNIKWY